MKLVYLTDQLLPQTATDTTQLVSMASAFALVQKESGGSTTIVCPGSWTRSAASAAEIAQYYAVEEGFRVEPVRSVYPFVRGIEKLAQGWRAPASKVAREGDVLYTRTLPVLITALVLGAGPIVYETYRPWPIQSPYSHELFRWIGNHPLFLGAVLHSDYARNSYRDIGISPDKLLTAYNGFDHSHFKQMLSQEAAKTILGWDQGRKHVVYSGRISGRKGLDVVLDMAKRLPEVEFALVGSEGRGVIEAEAETIKNVSVYPWGSIPDTMPFLAASDVLVIPPSKQPLEAVGNTVLPIKTFMYLAAGRPILAGSTPDLAEILKDGSNARVIEPDDADLAAHALSALLDDQALCEKLSSAALRSVADLTWETRARKVLAFIEERLLAA